MYCALLNDGVMSPSCNGVTRIEVSTAGRVKLGGKILKPQQHRKRMRVRLHGRYYDTTKLMTKVTLGVYTEPRPLALEVWLPITESSLA